MSSTFELWHVWFGHAARHPDGEIIREVISPKPVAPWRSKRGGQFKTWTATLEEVLARLSGPSVFGPRRCNRDRLDEGSPSLDSRRSGCGWRHGCRRNGSQVDAVLSTTLVNYIHL